MDFDTRAQLLGEPSDNWSLEVTKLHAENKERLKAELMLEFGERGFEEKLNNFRDLGDLPFSIVSHHNALLYQARVSFVLGNFYPALTAACALGERILNHLILDLRNCYPPSAIDRKVRSRSSIDDWVKAVAILNEWKVLQKPAVGEEFLKLASLRHRSLHFSSGTIVNLREDALMALRSLSAIVGSQFGFLLEKIIPGTAGAFFLRAESESDPFVSKYYLSQCFHVSPFYAMRNVNGTWLCFDRWEAPGRSVEDEEFVGLYMSRRPEDLTPTDIPWSEGVNVFAALPDGVRQVDYHAST